MKLKSLFASLILVLAGCGTVERNTTTKVERRDDGSVKKIETKTVERTNSTDKVNIEIKK